MTRPLVIVQSSPTKQTAYDLALAARLRGFDVQDISFDRDAPQPPELGGHGPVFVFGSVALLERWARRHPEIAPWIWCDHDLLGPERWAERLGPLFLNASGERLSCAAFEQSERHGSGRWHVRALRSDKRPPGRLYARDEIAAMDLPGELGLWVSAPAAITDEVRVWFVGARAVAASQYRRGGELVRLVDTEATGAALDFAREAGAAFVPHPHCVMDVGRQPDGRWTVIEFNPINGAGWYAADPGVILDAYVAHFQSPSA